MNNRLTVLIGVLVVALIVVLWFFLLWSPNQEEIEELRAQVQTEQQFADQARVRAAQLRDVRSQAPELGAQLAVVENLVPGDVALPEILRQIELLASDAGVQLDNLSPSRPLASGGEDVAYNAVELSFNVQGTYFQLIDLARRLEDPDLMGRGLTWRFGTFGIAEEFPNLSGSLAATVYARSPATVADEEDAVDDGENGNAELAPEPGTRDDPPPRPDGGEEEELIS